MRNFVLNELVSCTKLIRLFKTIISAPFSIDIFCAYLFLNLLEFKTQYLFGERERASLFSKFGGNLKIQIYSP